MHSILKTDDCKNFSNNPIGYCISQPCIHLAYNINSWFK